VLDAAPHVTASGLVLTHQHTTQIKHTRQREDVRMEHKYCNRTGETRGRQARRQAPPSQMCQRARAHMQTYLNATGGQRVRGGGRCLGPRGRRSKESRCRWG
jgi:hypothetical protein